MPKVTISTGALRNDADIDQMQAALQSVVGSITQLKAHERLIDSAGVRLDRAGAKLLYYLHAQGGALRVTDLAELLNVDTPTVTRKIQQLERQDLVSRHPDPDDGRAIRITLTRTGKRATERVLQARREWYERLVEDFDDAELSTFASLLGRFSSALGHDLEDIRDN